MSNEAFEPPKHHCAVALSQDFAQVVREAAEKSGRTFAEQAVSFMIVGADCERIHQERK